MSSTRGSRGPVYLFWHLAGRWSQVRSDGVAVFLPLAHTVFGRLVAARHPSVTTVLAQLAGDKLVTLIDDGWLRSGSSTGELTEIAVTTVEVRPESALEGGEGGERKLAGVGVGRRRGLISHAAPSDPRAARPTRATNSRSAKGPVRLAREGIIRVW